MILHSLDKYRDQGLLILRLGMGAMFLWHGWPKITGGMEMWTKVGGAMAVFGISFAPAFWGFMAALAEAGGGALLLLGLLTRPACAMMAFTMAVATATHLNKGDGLKGASHAVEAGILFASLIFIGPGRFSLDHLWHSRSARPPGA